MSVLCGNRKAHGSDRVYHASTAQVHACYFAPVEPPVVEPEPVFEECEHGMAKWLCDDPVTHYPSDEQLGGRYATESEAHAEWHRNAGVPMGQPGCPQDACHPPEDYDYEPEPEITAEDVFPISPPPPATGLLLYDGIYTVEEDGGGHRTFRVRTQGKDEEFAPGKKVISYLSGPDNEHAYTGFGFVNDGILTSRVVVWNRYKGNADLVAAAERLAANPEAALQAAHCARCHRVLTVPASIHNGLGPECAKKGL